MTVSAAKPCAGAWSHRVSLSYELAAFRASYKDSFYMRFGMRCAVCSTALIARLDLDQGDSLP